MRQRLGIAHALLGDPEVLILDEPANGLDPAGIRWMRDLLRGFADEGGTVFLCSHLLNEIERVADDLVVIGPAGSSPRGPRTNCSAAAAPARVPTTSRCWRGSPRPSVVPQRTPTGGLRSTPSPSPSTGSPPPARSCSPNCGRRRRGLEELFLDLTAAAAREEVAA